MRLCSHNVRVASKALLGNDVYYRVACNTDCLFGVYISNKPGVFAAQAANVVFEPSTAMSGFAERRHP